ncbi:MAG TPA: hypothetical protein VJH55_02230 [Candidatus Paceibacterota bacterium]
MSQYTCKLLTDDGVFYVAFCNTVDQFISKAFRKVSDVAHVLSRIFREPVSESDCRECANHHVFDMRREARYRALVLIEKLKRGEPLSNTEAAEMYRFHEFLAATVAPHQSGLEKDVPKIESWIKGLGLRTKIPEIAKYDWWEMMTDRACYPAFQIHRYRDRGYARDTETLAATLPEQRKLAGLYVGHMASVARLTGPRKQSPTKIVEKFRNKFFR